MVKIIVHGYLGKMGRRIIDLSKNNDSCQIVAGIDKNCQQSADSNMPFPGFSSIGECDMPADVIIDFSYAGAVDEVINYAVAKKMALIECTTGLTEATNEALKEAAAKTAVFKSANMSLGINLLAALLEKVSGILYDENFDAEIIESHHNKKIDAPSGTAFLLGEAIKNSVNQDLYYSFDRSQKREPRDKKEIGLSAIRGGTIVGEHEVIFAGQDEVIKLKHSAYSKDLFATGALKAAVFLKDKPPGFYNMKDLMQEVLAGI